MHGKEVFNWIKEQYPEDWKISKRETKKLIKQLEGDIQKEKDLPRDVKKEWPALMFAKWRWEFIRRSELFQSDCNKIKEKIDTQTFITRDGQRQPPNFGKYGHIMVDLSEFCFIWGLESIPLVGSNLVFTDYLQTFTELLTSFYALLHVEKKQCEKTIKSWVKGFARSENGHGYPGSFFEIKKVGPRRKTIEKPSIATEEYLNIHHLEIKISAAATDSGKLHKALSDIPVPIYQARDHYFDDGTYMLKLWVAKLGMPTILDLRKERSNNIWHKDIIEIEKALVASIGWELPGVDPRNEMRSALEGQLWTLDLKLGWAYRKRGDKDQSYYRWKKSANQKINRIETAVTSRKSLFKSILSS
jgi:hypothetical protein